MTGRSGTITTSLVPRAILLVAIASLLHVVVLHRIALFGVVPGSLLVLTAVAAVETGPEVGCFIGFLAGLALNAIDLDSPVGATSLLLCVTGWLVGRARDRMFPGAQRVPFALVGLASLLATGFYGVLLTVSRGADARTFLHLLIVVAVSLVLNPVISLLLAPLTRIVLGVNWNRA